MKQLIKKYTLILIIALVLAYLLAIVILWIWPDLLSYKAEDGFTHTLGKNILIKGLQYLMNIAIIIVIIKDMKRLNLKSLSILILTFFSSLIGIIFFLLIIKNQNINSLINNSND